MFDRFILQQNRLYLNKLDINAIRIFRFAFAVTLSVLLAFGLGWPLSIILPVFTIVFLKAPAPCPSFKVSLSIIVMTMAYLLAGFMISLVFVRYPLVMLVINSLLIFLIFYRSLKSENMLATLFALIGVLVIPLMMQTSQNMAMLVMTGLIFAVTAALLLVWLAFTVFPDPDLTHSETHSEKMPELTLPVLTQQQQVNLAWQKTLMVLPVLILFFTFNLSGQLLTLIFIALLAMSPGLSEGISAGKFMIIGNTLGGLYAMMFYELLVMVPMFGFFISLTLLVSLLLAKQIFQGNAVSSALHGSAATTLFLLIGTGTMPFGGDEVDDKFYIRIFLVILATLYIVFAFALINGFRRDRD